MVTSSDITQVCGASLEFGIKEVLTSCVRTFVWGPQAGVCTYNESLGNHIKTGSGHFWPKVARLSTYSTFGMIYYYFVIPRYLKVGAFLINKMNSVAR